MTQLKLTAAHQSTRQSSTLTKKQRDNQRKIARLGDIWPIFFTNPPLPLSIGIDEFLRKEVASRRLDLTDAQIRQGLYAYTRRRVYKQALATGTYRYDQHGVITETLTDAHKEAAKGELRKLQKQKKAKPKSSETPVQKKPQPVKTHKPDDAKPSATPSRKKDANRVAAPRPTIIYKKRPKKRQITEEV